MLAKLLYTIDENVSLPPNGLKSVKRLAKSISSINEDFWACKVLASTSVVDIYSDNQTVQDQVSFFSCITVPYDVTSQNITLISLTKDL